MPGLDESETERTGLPAMIGLARSARPSLAHSAPTAAFVSQLIAARDRLGAQDLARRGIAAGAYGRGARIADRRMPLGYRKTVIA